MAQQVELPAAKAANVSLIPRAYMVKNKVLQLFSDLHTCTVACTSHMHACRHTHVHTHTYNKYNMYLIGHSGFFSLVVCLVAST